MSKNLIYIVAVDNHTSRIPVLEYAQYSIKTWKWYCDKHGIDLLVVDRNQLDAFDYPIWNKEMIYVLGEGYDKIGIVDCDTIIKWDAPNIFDRIDPDKFYGVNDLCDLNWLFDSIDQRQKFFPDIEMDISSYINAGVVFFGNAYLYVFKELLEFWMANKDEINAIKGGGKEQTLLNFVLQKNKVQIELLSPEWNLLSIHRKNRFVNNWQLNQIDPNNHQVPHFLKYGKIWHFTGFPIEDRVRIMKQTWDIIKGNYV